MLFNSLEFAIFLPLVFLLYWFVFDYALKRCTQQLLWQNLFLLLASYVFYAWWDWRFLGLLVGMSAISYFSHQLIQKFPNHGKIWMWMAIAIDLVVLGFFKYYNFFVDSFATLFGLETSILSLKIVLPLGISFFTFQAISYVVDAYKNKLPHCSWLDCFLYIGFFPKLLAGPIERTSNLLPQIQTKREFSYNQAVDGCRQILWGLFKKVVVADNCAMFVNSIYADYANQTGSTLLVAAILYTIQIYGDFSGYSDMAIGTGKLLGFRFRDNFLFPYFSRNMNEFWRRWHISLNTWFVDYVYIPLGGSRDGKAKTIANTMIIFLLSGLWHGADWSFVCWGAYHGLLLVILILINKNTKFDSVVAYNHHLPTLKELGQMIFVFVLATIGWMMFRADNMTIFVEYCQRMMNASLFTMPTIMGNNFLLMNIAILFVTEWLMRRERHGLDLAKVHSPWVRYALYGIFMYLFFAFGGHTENFIYMYF